MMWLALALLGFISASVGSTLGIGGGSIAVPVMVGLMSISPAEAVSSSLMMIIVTSLVAALNYYKMGLVDLRLALLLESATIPGVILGVHLNELLGETYLIPILSIVLLLMGVRLFSMKREEEEERVAQAEYLRGNYLKAGSLAFLAGTLSGSLGLGGGVLKVPLMLTLGVPTKVAVGTSSLMISFTATVGAITYALKGHLCLSTVLPLALGALLGANVGPNLLKRIDGKYIRLAFALLLTLLALQLMYQFIGRAVS